MTKQPHQRLLSTYYVLSHFIAVWPWAILLYKFPVAAVTNDHKLASFKQRKFILPQSGGQKSEICISGPKSRCQRCTCWEGPRGEFVPCLFWFLMAPDVPDLWLHNSGLCLCLHVVFSSVYVKSLSVSFFFSFFFGLTIRFVGSSQTRDRLCPPAVETRVLATGPLGKSPVSFL